MNSAAMRATFWFAIKKRKIIIFVQPRMLENATLIAWMHFVTNAGKWKSRAANLPTGNVDLTKVDQHKAADSFACPSIFIICQLVWCSILVSGIVSLRSSKTIIMHFQEFWWAPLYTIKLFGVHLYTQFPEKVFYLMSLYNPFFPLRQPVKWVSYARRDRSFILKFNDHLVAALRLRIICAKSRHASLYFIAGE